MKIDLHVHSKEYSSCGRSSAEEQISAAIEAGLDAIVFSNHNRLVPQELLQQFNFKYEPFRVFGGIEIDINSEHLLVLGIHDPVLERRQLSYPELYKFVRDQGGFLALAHPFRYSEYIEIAIENFPTDAIELYSNNTPEDEQERIQTVAHRLGLHVLSNSDAHHTTEVGRYYNRLKRTPSNEQELIEILKAGQFRCVSPL